ncbi:MAG: two-component regulator propeller domain-containing protein, partial [Salibacteraceae bacterium]
MLHGQAPSYLHFRVEEGLPSNEVYQTVQDERGYIWLATDRGLVRYDGYRFRVFTEADGLPDKTIFGFTKDAQNRIWWFGHSDCIGYLQGDEIVLPDFLPELTQRFKSKVVASLHIDGEDTVWIALKERSQLIWIDPKGAIHERKMNMEPFMGRVIELNNGWVSGMAHRIGHQPQHPNHIRFEGKSKTVDWLLPGISNRWVVGTSVQKRGDTWFCSQNNGIIAFREDREVASVKLPGIATLSLYFDGEENLWVGMMGQGVMCFPGGDLSAKPKKYLQGLSVSSVFQDREGGYWITTLDDGVYYTRGRNIISQQLIYNDRPIGAKELEVHDSILWVGTATGQLFSRKMNPEAPLRLEDSNLGQVRALKSLPNCLVVGIPSSAGKNFLQVDKRWYLPSPAIGQKPGEDTLRMPISSWVALPPLVISMEMPYTEYARYGAIVPWQQGILAGNDLGLFFLDKNSYRQMKSYEALKVSGVTDLGVSGSYLFVATQSLGLVVFDGKSSWTVGIADGLPTPHIEAIATQNDSIVWLGTKKGLVRVSLNHRKMVSKVTVISTAEGLPSVTISDLEIFENQIWLASTYGISFLDVNQDFYNPMPPPVWLQEVWTNGQRIELNRQSTFPPDALAFDFRFVGLNFGSSGKVLYRYRMKGLEEAWSTSTNREVRYMLSPGSYTFEVEARNESGVWSTTPARYTFTILAPVWQKTWFWIVLGLLFLGAGVLLVLWWLRRVKLRSELELGMARS